MELGESTFDHKWEQVELITALKVEEKLVPDKTNAHTEKWEEDRKIWVKSRKICCEWVEVGVDGAETIICRTNLHFIVRKIAPVWPVEESICATKEQHAGVVWQLAISKNKTHAPSD